MFALPQPYYRSMSMRHNFQLLATVVALAGFACLCSGCEREVGHMKETEIKDDGTVKTKEKTVTEDATGDTTIKETETTKKPGTPD